MYTPDDPAGKKGHKLAIGRSLLLALLYGRGDARLQGYRPAPLDRPLRDFHRAVEQAAMAGRRAFTALDDTRAMRCLAPLLARLNDGLRCALSRPAPAAW